MFWHLARITRREKTVAQSHPGNAGGLKIADGSEGQKRKDCFHYWKRLLDHAAQVTHFCLLSAVVAPSQPRVSRVSRITSMPPGRQRTLLWSSTYLMKACHTACCCCCCCCWEGCAWLGKYFPCLSPSYTSKLLSLEGVHTLIKKLLLASMERKPAPSTPFCNPAEQIKQKDEMMKIKNKEQTLYKRSVNKE